MARKISVTLLIGLLIINGAVALITAYSVYRSLTHDFAELGRQNARLGARMTEYILRKSIDNGVFSVSALFDRRYQLIEGSSPPRYHTVYDLYFERNMSTVQDAFLDADAIFYAYAITNDGYIPTQQPEVFQAAHPRSRSAHWPGLPGRDLQPLYCPEIVQAVDRNRKRSQDADRPKGFQLL